MYEKAFQTLVIALKDRMTDSFLVDVASGLVDIESDKDECMKVLKVRKYDDFLLFLVRSRFFLECFYR